MAKFIVELRKNDFGTDKNSPVEAYLGLKEIEDGHPDGPTLRVIPVAKREAATEYETPGHPRNDLNRLQDAFFDRYWPQIVEVV